MIEVFPDYFNKDGTVSRNRRTYKPRPRFWTVKVNGEVAQTGFATKTQAQSYGEMHLARIEERSPK